MEIIYLWYTDHQKNISMEVKCEIKWAKLFLTIYSLPLRENNLDTSVFFQKSKT